MLTAALHRVRRNLPLGARADLAELLDGGSLTSAEVEANLLDLERLNRLPGGAATSVAAIGQLVAGLAAAEILDVGVGAGDFPTGFARQGWHVTGIDVNREVLAVAQRRIRPEGVTLVEADARALPFADGAFDVAHCSLLVHHLDPRDAVQVLREMRRVARLGVVVNDLRRGVLPLAVTAVSMAALARSPVTRADGLASVRRAYTLVELDQLLADAGLRSTWRSAGWMPRVVTTAVRTAA